MLAHKRLGGLIHLRDIQLRCNARCKSIQMGMRNIGIQNQITIQLPFGSMTGMKIDRDFTGIPNDNVIWQPGLNSRAKLPGRDCRIRFETRHLTDCVHTGIGSSCAGQPRRFSRNLQDRPFDHFLNGDTIRLNLPAMIGTPVIGNGQLDISCWHRDFRFKKSISHKMNFSQACKTGKNQ